LPHGVTHPFSLYATVLIQSGASFTVDGYMSIVTIESGEI
jgi:hypothetical protein